MRHTWMIENVRSDSWLENIMEINHLTDLGIDGRIILKCIVND
jgi:hypothetical protein